MEQQIASIKEEVSVLCDKTSGIDVDSGNLLRDVVEKSTSSQKKQEILNNLIMTDLVRSETLSRLVSRLDGSASKSSISDSPDDIDARLHEVTNQLLELTSSQIPVTLEEYFGLFVAQRDNILAKISLVDSEYSEISTLQKMLQAADAEEAIARKRLSTDLKTLQLTAARINSELEYIKRERDNMKLRQASDYPQMPLKELLSGQDRSYNEEWKSLLHCARYSPLSSN